MEKILAEDWKDLVQQRLASYNKFLFTRHPFERLVSAYYDKFTSKSKVKAISFAPGNSVDAVLPKKNKKHKAETQVSNEKKKYVSYKLKIGTKIIEKYRVNPSKRSLETGYDVTIPEFISYVIDEWKERDEKPVDVHWRSMVDLCHPCSIKYDVIGKFETMQKDVDYLLNQLGEDKIGQYFKAYEPYATSSLVKDFMQEISKKQWNALLRIYRDDFDIFGYDPDVYKPTSFA